MKSRLILILSFYITCAFPQNKKIIFVCEHGAAKSVIAAGYFNKLARQRNLPYYAVSRATHPDSTLNEATRLGLKADSLYVAKRIPTIITGSDTSGVEKIILFTKLPSSFHTKIKIEDWSEIPDIDSAYTRRRNAIIKEITVLLDKLEKR